MLYPIVWIDPINRDAHFLKLISENMQLNLKDFKVISTQRLGMEISSNVTFIPFFNQKHAIPIGPISWNEKLQLTAKYQTYFQKAVNYIKPGSLVIYSSGMSLPELEGIGIRMIKRKASRVIMLVHNLEDTQSKLSWLSQWRNRRLLEIFDGWIFLSNYMRQRALSRLNIPPKKTYVMLHPHFHSMLKDIQPDEQLYSRIQQLAQGRPIIAYTSRADKNHGIDLFYKVLHDIQHKGAPVYGVVLGRLSKDWNSEKNETAIKSYGLSSENLYTKFGTYTYPELLAILKTADCTLAPYRHISQSGAIALALGEEVPVIASNVGANCEMLRNGINGLLFDANNLDELINEMVTTYTSNNTMRQRFPANPAFFSHLAPPTSVANMLHWMMTI